MNLFHKFLVYFFFVYTYAIGQIPIDKIIGYGAGNSIINASDGNLIFCGNRSGQLLISKIDSTGSEIWTSLFGLTTGVSPSNSGSNIIKVEANYLVTGRYDPGTGGYNKAYAVLIDESGNLIWENSFGNNNSYAKYSCYDNISKFIYITGSIQTGTPDIFLVKIDTSGNTIWENSYDFGESEIGESISVVDPNNIYIAGSTTSGSGNNMFNGYLMKIDSAGTLNFQKTFGGNLQDNIYDFKIMPDSGFLIVGTSNSYSSGNTDAWILRLDYDGDTLWTTTIGTSIIESSYSISFIDPAKIWICGKANSGPPNSDQGWLFEIDSSGSLINTFLFGGTNNEILSGLSNVNNNLYAIGKSSINLNDSIYFIKLDSLTLDSRINNSDINFSHTIFPNPSTSLIYLQVNQPFSICENDIKIFDLNGKKYSTNIEQDNSTLIIKLPEFQGTYILNFKISNINYSYKIIKL